MWSFPNSCLLPLPHPGSGGAVWHMAWKVDPVQEEKAWVASESRLVTGSGESNGFSLCLPQALTSGLGVPLSLPWLHQRNLGG